MIKKTFISLVLLTGLAFTTSPAKAGETRSSCEIINAPNGKIYENCTVRQFSDFDLFVENLLQMTPEQLEQLSNYYEEQARQMELENQKQQEATKKALEELNQITEKAFERAREGLHNGGMN